jgi:hypothetical protein
VCAAAAASWRKRRERVDGGWVALRAKVEKGADQAEEQIRQQINGQNHGPTKDN